MGAAGSGYVAHESGMVNFELVASLFPAWVMLPFLFMVISGLLSTADSNLCAAASLTSDFGGSMRTAKAAMLMQLALAIVIANVPGLTVTDLFLIYGTLRATTMLPTVLTLNGNALSPGGDYGGRCSVAGGRDDGFHSGDRLRQRGIENRGQLAGGFAFRLYQSGSRPQK